VIRAWKGGLESVALSLTPGGTGEAFIDVPPDGPLQSLAFTVRSEPRPEVVPLLPRPPVDLLVAHLVGAGFDAAQAFSAPSKGAALAGVDLYIKPLTPSVKGSVAVHADASGRPAEAPLEGSIAELAITSEARAPWPERWISVDLPAPALVKDQVFWVVLDVTEGEALWLLGDAPDADPRTEAAPRGAVFRAAGDVIWRERELPSSIALRPGSAPFAYARPRLRADAPPPPPLITVRWGASEVVVPVGEGGRVTLDAAALDALPRPKEGDPRIHILVRSAVAARVTLSDVELGASASQDFP
jgi:hypothetical protein